MQAEVTRPTFWQISRLGEAVFYYLSAVALLVFFVGIYERFARYRRGSADPFVRLGDLPRRIRRSARIVLSNQNLESETPQP